MSHNPYITFYSHLRQTDKKLKKLPVSEAAKVAGERWRAMKPAEKSKWHTKAKVRRMSGRSDDAKAEFDTAEKRDVAKAKYRDFPDNDFCGSAGGRNSHSFPIETVEEYDAASRYRRWAPNEEGLLNCMKKVAARKSKDQRLSAAERAQWAKRAASIPV